MSKSPREPVRVEAVGGGRDSREDSRTTILVGGREEVEVEVEEVEEEEEASIAAGALEEGSR